MSRSRLLIVSLIAGLCLLGTPFPLNAGPRFPDTVDRTFTLARGNVLRATPTQGASFARGSTGLPIRGNLIAISFRIADAEAVEDAVAFEGRFRTAKGWSGWQELHVEPEEGPDLGSAEERAGRGRAFSTPLWVGTADRMMLRATAEKGAPAVSDLRVHVINSLGNAHKPNLFARAASIVSRFLRGSSAEAMTSQPSIITRSRWGADERLRECCPRYAPSVQLAYIHHTVGTNSYSKSESAALVRGIYKYHTSNRGWSDIGYNFLVDRYGQIFEGRYGGITQPVVGAHVMGFNTGSTGISLMGTFTSASPTSAMTSALKRLLAWKLDVHHAPPVGTVVMTSGGNPKYPAGRRVTFNRISGHRDGQQTACPGAKVYYLLPSIRSAVKGIGLPKIYSPSLSNWFVRPDADAKDDLVTLRATFSTTLNWVAEFRTNGGLLLRRFSGRGTSMAAPWNGKTDTGLLPTSGVIRYTLAADSGSAIARPVTGLMYLVTDHPDGTLLYSGRRVALSGGDAWTVPSVLVRDSWYRIGEQVATGNGEIDRYPAGGAITMREGTVLSESGNYWIISGGVRRALAGPVYTALGYTAASALPISAAELATIPFGAPWNDVTKHPPGAIVRAADNSLWTIGTVQRRKNPTAIIHRSWYRNAEVVPAKAGDIALAVGTPITYREGTTFKLPDGSYWIISGGKKRRFYGAGLFSAMGYSTAVLFSMSTAEAATIESGTAIAEPTIEAPPPPWARGVFGELIGGGGR